MKRRWIAGALLMLAALLATLPLRVALGDMAGTGVPLRADAVRGTIWRGSLNGLTLGGVRLGDGEVRLLPLRLLNGRIAFALSVGQGNAPLQAEIARGWGKVSVTRLSGRLSGGQAFAPLPLDALEFDDVSFSLDGRGCTGAQGRVRAELAPAPGVPVLAEGLTGEARCDGPALLLPLTGRSGRERLSLRLAADGSASAQLALRADDDDVRSGEALRALGFVRAGTDWVLLADALR